MRTHLYSSLAALKIGSDILFKEEKVQADEIFGHGGLFKTKGVGQGILAAAMDAPFPLWKRPEKAAHGELRCWPLICGIRRTGKILPLFERIGICRKQGKQDGTCGRRCGGI